MLTMLIDAHTHLPVLSDPNPYPQALQKLLADLDADGGDYAILIPDNEAGSAIGDLQTCLELVEGEPRIFLLGVIDLETQGEAWIARLEQLLRQRKIVGMKIFPGHDPIYPTDPRLYPVYQLCQELHAPMMIHTGLNPGRPETAQFNDPKYIIQVAQDYPALKIIIAHYFFPQVDYCFELTRPFENIYFDTSGLADEEVIELTGLERIRSVLKKTLQDSPQRVIFGTDYNMCSRQAHIDLIDGLGLEPQVRENVFWRSAARLFHLQVSSAG